MIISHEKIRHLDENNKLIEDEVEVAEHCKQGIVEIIANLRSRVNDNSIPKENIVEEIFQLNPVSEGKMTKTLKSIGNTIPVGCNEISKVVPNSCAKILSIPLKLIINKSITSKTFPCLQ